MSPYIPMTLSETVSRACGVDGFQANSMITDAILEDDITEIIINRIKKNLVDCEFYENNPEAKERIDPFWRY